MISYIEGTIMLKGSLFIIINNHGIGYKVYVGERVLETTVLNQTIQLYTYQNVREDTLDLYGFAQIDELDLFEKLISVSGIGPKTALGVFAVASLSDIVSAIVNQDPAILKKVSGIGSKTAERVVLELKNKLDGLTGVTMKSKETMAEDSDALEALLSLGYPQAQAQQALQSIDPTITDISEKVKAALKELAV